MKCEKKDERCSDRACFCHIDEFDKFLPEQPTEPSQPDEHNCPSCKKPLVEIVDEVDGYYCPHGCFPDKTIFQPDTDVEPDGYLFDSELDQWYIISKEYNKEKHPRTANQRAEHMRAKGYRVQPFYSESTVTKLQAENKELKERIEKLEKENSRMITAGGVMTRLNLNLQSKLNEAVELLKKYDSLIITHGGDGDVEFFLNSLKQQKKGENDE